MTKEKILLMVIQAIIQRVDPDDMRRWMDKGLDMLEARVRATATPWDDRVILPLIATARQALFLDDDQPGR